MNSQSLGRRLAGLGLAVLLSGCATSTKEQLGSAQEAYQRRDYATSYAASAKLASAETGVASYDANYLAGMSAYQLNDLPTAMYYLNTASQSTDPTLAADAKATLGLIHRRQNRHGRAAALLVEAAPYLQGQDRANAYYYAALSEQYLGLWPQARTHLTLARNGSNDPAFQQKAQDQMHVTGWTIQVGAYTIRDNAATSAQRWTRRTTELRMRPPRLIDANSPDGRKLTLVQLGEFHTYDTANAMRDQLDNDDAIIVPLASR
jgi:hypothetical protein